MAAWVWLVAYIAGFALLQVALYRYFQQDSRGETAPSSSDAPSPSVEAAAEGTGDGVHCQHCGAANDPEFTYCKHCANQL